MATAKKAPPRLVKLVHEVDPKKVKELGFKPPPPPPPKVNTKPKGSK